MPQFGVSRNPGRNATGIPFVLQIQSSRLESSVFRVVMALPRLPDRTSDNHRLYPPLVIQGEAVFADPLNIVTLRRTALRHTLLVLPEPDQDRIIRAIDEMISRA